MRIAELFLIALGLSMDAFAVSVTNGLCNRDMKKRWIFLIAVTFGVFQGAMPTLGYALGQTFSGYIQEYDHYVALILLSFIGGKMLFEAIKGKSSDDCKIKKLTMGTLLVQGLATSVDALAVGVSFSVLKLNIVNAAAFITSVTFICSLIGVFIGIKFGSVFSKKAEIIGGFILIAIGVKIFVEHTFF